MQKIISSRCSRNHSHTIVSNPVKGPFLMCRYAVDVMVDIIFSIPEKYGKIKVS